MVKVEQESRVRKSERLEARLTPEQKALVQRAAALTGRSVSDFIVAGVTERAEDVIRAQQVVQLTAQDSAFFAQAALNPEEPNEALRAAARLHDEMITP